MDRWLERLGYAMQWAVDGALHAAESAREAASRAAETAGSATESLAERGEEMLPEGLSPLVLAGTALGFLAPRFLPEGEVRFSRAVLAGIVGTLLYDAEMALDQRVFQRKFDTISPLGEALTDDPDLQPWAGMAAHYAAGVGLAVFYARYLHDRLPGPPIARGLLFGVVDAALLAWGGVLPVCSRVAPHVRLPIGFHALSHCPSLTTQSVLRHAAYGIGVGLLYRGEEPASPLRRLREIPG